MATGNGNGGSRGRLRAFACAVCKDGKRKCHGGRPCNRCLRLNFSCQDPPKNDNAKGQQHQAPAASPPAPVAPGARNALTAIDHAVRATDPNALVRAVEETTVGLAQRGLLHRESVTHQLRGWHALCGGLHSDVSRGLFTRMIKALGIPEAEAYVKIKQEANLGVVPGESDANRMARARELHLRRLKIKSKRLADLKTFNEEDDGFTAVYMILYWGEHGLFLAVNEVFEDTFTNAARMLEMIIERGLLPEFLPLAWIHEEDRADFIELLFAVLFDPRTPFHPNRLVRMLDCEGNVTLRSVEVKAISTPDGKRGAAVKLHLAPQIKFLDPRFQALVPVPAPVPSSAIGANGGGVIDSKLPAPPAAPTAIASGASSHGPHGAWGAQVHPVMPFPPHAAAGGASMVAASAAAPGAYAPQNVFVPIDANASVSASSCESERGYDSPSSSTTPSASPIMMTVAGPAAPAAPSSFVPAAGAPKQDAAPIIITEDMVDAEVAHQEQSALTPTVDRICPEGVRFFEEQALEMVFDE